MAAFSQGPGDIVSYATGQPSLIHPRPTNDNAIQYFGQISTDAQPKNAVDGSNMVDELNRLRDELQFMKRADPFRTAEMALEIQIEKFKVMEISNAREAAVQRLAEAYTSIRLKNEVIENLQSKLIGKAGGDGSVITAGGTESQTVIPDGDLHLCKTSIVNADVDGMKAHIVNLETTIEDLRLSLRQMPPATLQPLHSPALCSDSPFGLSMRMLNDPPPRYELGLHKVSCNDCSVQTDPLEIYPTENSKQDQTLVMRAILAGLTDYVPPVIDDPAELVRAREELLAAIPLPDNPPDPTLSAIVIPPPFSLHEFLNTAPGDVSPFTECFYNKDGVWYYAGSYRAFKLDCLSTTEWAQLPNEVYLYHDACWVKVLTNSSQTISAIVKETIAARKNSSPQNTYETTQLYAAGALKVACVGLQCVGFNQEVYKSMIEHSIKFGESKWKTMIPPSLGTPSSIPSPISQPGTGGSMSSIGSVSASGSASSSVRVRSPVAGMTTALLTSGSKVSPGIRVNQGPRAAPSLMGAVSGVGGIHAVQACTPVSSPSNMLATPSSMNGSTTGVVLGDSGSGLSLGSSAWNGKTGGHVGMLGSAALGVLQSSPTPLRGVGAVGMSKMGGGIFEGAEKH
ncbi:hypothetical protein CVT24_006590 [Panaeolus cyanescens]|uniref:DUF6697 domain-containing protein n=1 Tax=Panaeolus cyanescens TaxID=181874 RepID=A0A409WNV3_9AGAR|nr:hypothetical protein CVT24_006590 [Panaeolus cyanescens]